MKQLRRTLTLTGAPFPSQGSRINANGLIKAAGSAECLQFRKWLQTDAPNKSDSEIQEQFGSWSESVRCFFGSGMGRHLKFLAFTAVGLGLSPAAGVAMAVLDFYLLDRMLKPSGHVLFLNQTSRGVPPPSPRIFSCATELNCERA